MLNCNTVVRSCFLTEDFKGTRFSTSVAEAMLYIHQNIPLFFFAIYTENYIYKQQCLQFGKTTDSLHTAIVSESTVHPGR